MLQLHNSQNLTITTQGACVKTQNQGKKNLHLHMGYCPFLVKLLRGEKIFVYIPLHG
jgi:hypothetical protein